MYQTFFEFVACPGIFRTDVLTVNTLEAIYGQESSFGILRRSPGIGGAVGEFHIEKKTAERYGLIVTKDNDQRFDRVRCGGIVLLEHGPYRRRAHLQRAPWALA